MTESKDMVSSSGPVAMSIKVNTNWTSETVMERCTGQTEVAIKVSGSEESNTATER